MLVLIRKTGQKLLIGSNIEIKVLEIHGDSAKIGISAPKNVAIYREELYLEICKANQTAQTDTAGASADVLTAAAKMAKKPATSSAKPSIANPTASPAKRPTS